MDLTAHIAASSVVVPLAARDKGAALRELTCALFSGGRAKYREAVLDQLVRREALESTGVGLGVALPHARVPELKDLACAVGVSRRGLDFRALDREPVFLVLLICYPPAKQSSYLNFVASVVTLLRDEKRRAELVGAEDPKAVLELLATGSEELRRVEAAAASRDGARRPRQRGAPGPAAGTLAQTELFLLARLEFYRQLMASRKTGRPPLQERIENIRSLLRPETLKHYDRLARRPGLAIVTLEGDVCQGCLVRLPSHAVQTIRQRTDAVPTCVNCRRFLYPR